MDRITIEMDTAAVIAALNTFGAAAQPRLNAAAKVTADAIEREAFIRLERQLGPNATGKTAAGITVRPAHDGNGYIVIAERDPFPSLPFWLEKGTKKGKSHHPNVARPFFYVSALLEEGNHRRRIVEALQATIDEKGLGD